MGGFDLDTIALGAAAAATMLAAIGALPQVRLVVRTGDVRGVSFSMVTLGAAAEAGWFAHFASRGQWAAVPASFVIVAAYGALGVALARAGSRPRQPVAIGACWAVVLIGSRFLIGPGSTRSPARGDRGRPGHSAGLDRVADQTPNRGLVDRCGRWPSSRPPCGPASAWCTATPRSCSSAPSGRRLGSPCSFE